MSRTNELRMLIKTMLDTLKGENLKEVFYKTSGENSLFPHIVFQLSEINLMNDDNNRRNYILEIDIWDKNLSEERALALSDCVEDVFNQANIPFQNIYPTFYLDSGRSIIDEDKRIKHELIKFTIQLYE